MKKLILLSIILLACNLAQGTSIRPMYYSDNTEVQAKIDRCQLAGEIIGAQSQTAEERNQCLEQLKKQYPNDVQYGIPKKAADNMLSPKYTDVELAIKMNE